MSHVEDPNSVDLRASERFGAAEERLAGLFAAFPLDGRERLHELPLFVMPHVLRRVLFMAELYKTILDVPGVVMELGVRHGRDLATFEALRAVFEPLNYGRKVVGFDTFTGFPSVAPEDGSSALAKVGTYSAGGRDYQDYLGDVLATREGLAPFEHFAKFELRAGDAAVEVPRYLEANPHTIVALAYFDFDLYAPTKACLEALKPHLTKGSVLGFDELNCEDFPGETVALREVLGLDTHRLRRFGGWSPGMPSYLVIE